MMALCIWFPFPVPFSAWVTSVARYWVILAKRRSASLAYLMASEKTGHEMTRADAMQDESFRQAFNEARQQLRDSSVAFIEISNPVELYLFEAYCALEL